MKKSRWASLALASSLVWTAGGCCHWFEDSCSHHGGRLTSRPAPAPCECPPGTVPATAVGGQQFHGAAVYGASQVYDGMIYGGEGPPLITPETFPAAVGPPRIVPVPQANPIPYRP